MATILTVEDSRAVRNVIARQVLDLGFELEQAENGEQGLEKLEGRSIDLVLLDVTMPILDGPGMLARMRSAGNRTPVIMLTSEAKRSIVEDTLRLGISDYVLKPFASDELRTKILAVLGEAPAPAVQAPLPVVAPSSAFAVPKVSPEPAPVAAVPNRVVSKPVVTDVLIVDDMENVAKKLRALVPEAHSIEHCLTAEAALRLVRERTFKAVLVDSDLPAPVGASDVRGGALVSQLKAAQPRAAIVALCLRTTNDSSHEMRALGYSEVLFKPFRQEAVDELVVAHLLEREEVLTRADDLLTLGALAGRAERQDGYFERLAALAPSALEQVAAACHEHVIVDLRRAPVQAPRFGEAVVAIANHARQTGLGTKLIVAEAGKRALSVFPGARVLWKFESVDAARATDVDPNSEPPSEKESWITRMQDL
jgi:two-component system, cell cycle response regulator